MSLPELPITPTLPAIAERLAKGHLVLGAPPGSGKTTLVPLALRDADWLQGRKILMLEPRRPAARMAAHRMVQLLGEAIGETVGYQIRFDRRIGRDTRIEVLTEGLLLRRLQADPELSEVGLVIFDEFHERSLHADLSLALCRDVADGLREDLRLLLMSASLDGETLAQQLDADWLQAEGRAHPVTLHHLQRDPEARDRLQTVERLIRQALDRHAGDLLVFLPGKGEIGRLREALTDLESQKIRIQALHGEIPPGEQDAIIRGAGQGRRIVLATDIAETSLTIEGIRVVIDSGLTRKPAFDPNSGLSCLETRFISRASALQRAGRAGRQAPGDCYRAWSEARHARLDETSPPEILEAELAPLVLELAGWGVRSADALQWITPPPAPHLDQARELLRQLDALDDHDRITATGRTLLRLPLHPRLARMLLSAAPAARRMACDLAALLGERDPLRSRRGEPTPCDLQPRLQALATWREQRKPGDADPGALARIDQVSRQLERLLRAIEPGTLDTPGALLAAAYPERIALARSDGDAAYRLRNGRGARLPEHDGLRGERLLAIAALDAGQREARIWLAATLDETTLQRHFAHWLETDRELRWDAQREAVVARRCRRLGTLVLDEQPEPLGSDDDPQPLLLEQIRQRGLDLFEQTAALRRLQGRLALARRHLGEDWPDAGDTTLLASLEDWLAPWLNGITGLRALRRLDPAEALRQWLGWDRIRQLDALLPEHLLTPAGSRRAIDYPQDGDPILRVPLQELYGERETPCIAGGRIPLTLHLLSPAGRPLQVTRDLGHFWANAYREVRKEMRGRYPKHHWPEDPLNATPARPGRRHAPT